MSVLDEIENLEQSMMERRYSNIVLETAGKVEHLFDGRESALEFAQAYEETYDRRSDFYSPVEYAERWHESFDGDMSGVTDELLYED